ncbi:hypothetical protein P3T37_007388 [Kitasatospora sp. MAA4]|uniref:hypothetical protein n=1 Tax=Kitasatospora sp. MAA4 TaxID=3035093 RepID=UPI00247493BC|nr:hypothetical protein [Kitasatospora sp. MAA4]MDH6137950.1 hypothetical protein [Kitasatospora sp. MAA4]
MTASDRPLDPARAQTMFATGERLGFVYREEREQPYPRAQPPAPSAPRARVSARDLILASKALTVLSTTLLLLSALAWPFVALSAGRSAATTVIFFAFGLLLAALATATAMLTAAAVLRIRVWQRRRDLARGHTAQLELWRAAQVLWAVEDKRSRARSALWHAVGVAGGVRGGSTSSVGRMTGRGGGRRCSRCTGRRRWGRVRRRS